MKVLLEHRENFDYSYEELQKCSINLIKKYRRKYKININLASQDDFVSDIIFSIWRCHKTYKLSGASSWNNYLVKRSEWEINKIFRKQTLEIKKIQRYRKYLLDNSSNPTKSKNIELINDVLIFLSSEPLNYNYTIFINKIFKNKPTKVIAKEMKVSRQYVERVVKQTSKYLWIKYFDKHTG